VSGLQKGDRVDVVLDVVREGDGYRVYLSGVLPPGGKPPALRPGAQRNVCQTWLSLNHDVRAFYIADEVTP
jgi:hypothetical protein